MSRDPARRVGLEILARSFLGMRPPDRVMRQLGTIMREIDAPEGTVLYERGAPSNEVFMIREGRVALVGDDDSRWIFEDQSMIGVVDATLDRAHARTAVVEARVHGAKVAFADYLEVLEDNFDFTMRLMQRGFWLAYQTGLRLAPDGVFPPPSEDVVLMHCCEGKDRLDTFARLTVLDRSVLLRDAPVQPLVTLANHAEEVRVGTGERILERGAPNTAFLIVATGLVECRRTDPDVVARFGPGDLVSGAAAVGSDENELDAVALEPSVLLRISREDLYDVMEDHFGVVRAMFAYNARDNARVRRLLEERQGANLEVEEAV